MTGEPDGVRDGEGVRTWAVGEIEYADNGVSVGSMEVCCEGGEESNKEGEPLGDTDKVKPTGEPVIEGTNGVSVLVVEKGAAVG